MRKILLALDAHQIKMSAVDFACYLARVSRSRLTGVFLEDVLADRPDLAASIAYGLPLSAAPITGELQQELVEKTEENIRHFREACVCREVVSRVHRDRGVPVGEIVDESRFADLIVVDPETSFAQRVESIPARFVSDMLVDAECPVVLTPSSFDRIDEIVFAYNGTASSVFAIKQFTYLFPEYRETKTQVVNVRQEEDKSIEDSFKIKEWLNEHYAQVEFHLLKGSPTDKLFGYLLDRKNAFVVMGAYGRGMISRFFRASHARLIMRTLNLPIFIAH
jgi:nucleotide-binding universal stress UspA family protein